MSDYFAALQRVADARLKSAEKILRAKNHSPHQKLVNLFNLLMAGIEQQITLDLAEMDVRPACKQGCHWCCCIKISCTPVEAIMAALWLRQGRPELIPALLTFTDQTRQEGIERRWRRGAWCPFLVNHECAIYPARPMPCRAYLSLKANDCKVASRELRHGKGDHHVPYLNHLLHANSSMMAGVSEACNRAGLDCAPVEFTLAVRIALEEKDVVARFLAGEHLFEQARSHEVHMEDITRTLREIQLYGDLAEAVPNSSGVMRGLNPDKAAHLVRNKKSH